ncbi:50S ribosomal protein L33 [Loigolactobacillus jiayinensis]|uniref:Large ribosomal subunit protein bL33 n=1 Tax=Loigolactobacillus jiayinensis TaxID=2486016 RepID=A0ABW1RDZ9_9LACO|nr:50S ribosomal protein L33 [Loigolactobacillus jiayinensis]
MASVKVSLACTVCGARNYTVTVKPHHTQRLTLNKYCKHCQKETQHQETR